ncbi:hypothetical protein F8388_015783 [Cannabis sativa]|uniref:Lipoxygenase domain-containing protein n=1 Tax=Cannabis sativa TaxID=3483 RepID=A0A7J6FG61_CANSA|nr:hypothetical protein F8388_015783 [Cannabis sativa]
MSVRCNTGSHSHNRISIEKEDGSGKTTTTKGSGKIKGNVVLMKKNVLDFNDFNASFLDRVHELFGQRVSLQLVSAVNGDPDSTSSATSWVYPSDKYIPLEFSSLIREEELANLRGNGTGERQEWDRIYDYDYYNDLGNPVKALICSSCSWRLSSVSLSLAEEELGENEQIQFLKPEIEDLFNSTPNEFDSIDDVFKLYEGGVDVPEGLLKSVRDNIPAEMLKEIFRTDGERFLKFPVPQVIKVQKRLRTKTAWDTDEEFAREMLAGINPVMIHRLQAIRNNKVFILDHHDTLIPFLRRINATNTKIYATRTIIFLQKDGTLKPLAIELSLPHPGGDHFCCISKVYTPADKGVDGSLWQLAKAYAAERGSSINKLLHPHFRDTMNLNAVARQILINAGGALEATVFPGRYCMEMTSASTRSGLFLAKHFLLGVAVEDENSPHGLRLLIDDYPFAVDGLEI